MPDKLTYCGTLVRKHDPDRFLLSLFAPERTRPDLWALFAFNHEIAKTRETVSETQLGLIRLQWWREQIGQIYETGKASQHEILQALAIAIKNHNLPRDQFDAMVYGREFDLEDVLPATTEGMLKYAENINLPLMKLAAKIVGTDEDVGQLARNFGLTRLLHAVPYHAGQERCYLPQDLLDQAGINVWSFYKGKNQKDIIKIIQILKKNISEIRLNNKFLQAHQNLTQIYLKNLDKNQGNVFTKIPPRFKELRLFLYSLF